MVYWSIYLNEKGVSAFERFSNGLIEPIAGVCTDIILLCYGFLGFLECSCYLLDLVKFHTLNIENHWTTHKSSRICRRIIIIKVLYYGGAKKTRRESVQ